MSREPRRVGPSKGCVAIAFAGALLLEAGRATAGNEAAAQALFDEAKKLASQGKFAEACPKFAESNRLDRGAGTLIHLGDCYEKNKQTASAWATFAEAASAAQALGRKDWEKLAAQRAAALEPKLARLTINVDPANESAEVSRDGTAISQASWGVPIPVDVGTHTVQASKAGSKAFKTVATVSKDGESVEVTVPKLDVETSPSPPAPVPTPAPTTEPSSPPDADKGDGSQQRTIGFVVGGVGVAGLAVGAITGLMAMGKSSDAKNACANDGPCANRGAVDASESAKSLGLVSTIGFIAGGVGLAAGALLVLTAPPDAKKAAVRVTPNAGPNGGGVTLLGAF
jgi:hypothetical protein